MAIVLAGCSKDVIFVLDDSGSIGLTNFKHAIDFVRAIVSALDIGPHNSQVGLLVFSSHPQVRELFVLTDRLTRWKIRNR